MLNQVYIYNGDIYCEQCGNEICKTLDSRGVDDTGDSDDYPQGPYNDGGGEADVPQHCGSHANCVDAMTIDGRKVGLFLGNPLTSYGYEYVREALANKPDNAVVQMWADWYGITTNSFDNR
jgi:hypothetical protein